MEAPAGGVEVLVRAGVVVFSSAVAVEHENDGVVSEVVAAIIFFVLFKVSGEEEEFPTDSSCSTSEDVIPSKV